MTEYFFLFSMNLLADTVPLFSDN